ncbi:MAG TPA: YhcH/YjgK/YiaL family protein [Bacteroidales bacterium]
MVLDRIENVALYESLHPGIKTAFDFINKTDFSSFLPGKYELEGDKIFVLVNEYETKKASETYPEAHRKYIDIQLMVSGSEKFGYAAFSGQKVQSEYNLIKDIAFFNSEVDFFELNPGMFAIFFKNELHQPGIFIGKPETVKKVVVKVLANFLEVK